MFCVLAFKVLLGEEHRRQTIAASSVALVLAFSLSRRRRFVGGEGISPFSIHSAMAGMCFPISSELDSKISSMTASIRFRFRFPDADIVSTVFRVESKQIDRQERNVRVSRQHVTKIRNNTNATTENTNKAKYSTRKHLEVTAQTGQNLLFRLMTLNFKYVTGIFFVPFETTHGEVFFRKSTAF